MQMWLINKDLNIMKKMFSSHLKNSLNFFFFFLIILSLVSRLLNNGQLFCHENKRS